ncbi:hypothetical protein Micbo1qcDRAFT_166061 [Microdochium bolleyi]|uniref:Uncharacterized protein n=1 Tax=Microdochium bolleyi TaxID=196109 RepID=A0A136IW68_9PEZI|nr:hypothetical protein Micbo1qcDRAFT_166061 [Microdochium bolleyi]
MSVLRSGSIGAQDLQVMWMVVATMHANTFIVVGCGKDNKNEWWLVPQDETWSRVWTCTSRPRRLEVIF